MPGTYLLGGLFLLGTNVFALLIPWLLKLAVESFQAKSTAAHSPAFYAGSSSWPLPSSRG